MIESLVTCAVILIVVIGSGIFLAIKGTDYVAYSLIGVGIILECKSLKIANSLLKSYFFSIFDPWHTFGLWTKEQLH